MVSEVEVQKRGTGMDWIRAKPKPSRTNSLYSIAPCPTARTHNALMWALKCLGSPTPAALLAAAHMAFLLGWLSLLPVVFLCTHSTFLASLTPWSLYCSFCFTLAASCDTLSGAAYWISDLATHLFSGKLQVFQIFLFCFLLLILDCKCGQKQLVISMLQSECCAVLKLFPPDPLVHHV